MRCDGSLAQAVALVTSFVRIGQHLLSYRLATAVGLDAVDHRLQLIGSVDRENFAHLVAFRVPVLEPQQLAWSGRSSRCGWSANSRVSPANTTTVNQDLSLQRAALKAAVAAQSPSYFFAFSYG